MNFIVFDLEATCWETEQEKRRRKQEIIEIGALMVDEEGETVSRFEKFVRPVAHPMLSDFCKKLTNISQIDVNKAAIFPDVIEDFMDWIGLHDGEEYLLCSWGFFDRKALMKDCEQHGLDGEWAREHISLKHQYPRFKGIRMPIGLNRALEREGFEFEGAMHRGIDDAINLAKIFKKYQTQWRY
ncbi:MAG: exonuclease domain-containing protein [Aureispira sp.]|nr:exonuclease domain-containing protein [Aureispira sp.]